MSEEICQSSESFPTILCFDDDGGETVLRYAKLRLWDAEGNELPEEMALADDRMQLWGDARDAPLPPDHRPDFHQ